jgi:CheY-like chemotaxis protein
MDVRASATHDASGVLQDVRWTMREAKRGAGPSDGADRADGRAILETYNHELEMTVARQAKLIDELTRQASASSSSMLAAAELSSVVELSDLADLTGLRVLVVDDDDDARELLTAVLADCGARVLEVSTAEEAIELVALERPDVLVSDIGLPGTTGYDLIRDVRALGPERGGQVPAIALTGYAAIEDSREALRAGYQVHVAKPIDPSLLTHAVANVAGVSIVDLTT